MLSGPAVLELADIATISFGQPVPVAPSPAAPIRAGEPFRLVREARLLVVATPAYKGTFTGLLKIFLDQLGGREFAGAAAVSVAVAAAEPHRRRPPPP